MSESIYYWQKVVGNKELKLNLEGLKKDVEETFANESDAYKQKLVYNLLEAVRNNDQKEFLYVLLKSINKPKENYKSLWIGLKNNYDVMPEEAFINFAYTIILGIMATYGGE
ncbi:MAG: hypothetical protein ACPLZ9_00325 [Candidatus Ratteibacteria bacterium]